MTKGCRTDYAGAPLRPWASSLVDDCYLRYDATWDFEVTGAGARYVACSAAEALDMNESSGGGREVISLFVEAKSHASGTTLIAFKGGTIDHMEGGW